LIRALREAAGLTQRELAERIGSTQSVISRLESDDYDGHSLSMLTDTSWYWGFASLGDAADENAAPAAAARAASADAGRSFQRLWENAIRWLVRDPALSLLRVDLDKSELGHGEKPVVRVRTLRPDYTAAGGVPVTLEVTTDRAAPPAAAGEGGADGEAHPDLPALPPGAYRIRAKARLEGQDVVEEQTFLVAPEGRELDDVRYRPELLEAIAKASGGRFRDDGDLAGLPVRASREVRVGAQETRELWSHPLVLVLALLLLGSEWALRRRAGHA